jgi:hypothetical protein
MEFILFSLYSNNNEYFLGRNMDLSRSCSIRKIGKSVRSHNPNPYPNNSLATPRPGSWVLQLAVSAIAVVFQVFIIAKTTSTLGSSGSRAV